MQIWGFVVPTVSTKTKRKQNNSLVSKKNILVEIFETPLRFISGEASPALRTHFPRFF